MGCSVEQMSGVVVFVCTKSCVSLKTKQINKGEDSVFSCFNSCGNTGTEKNRSENIKT